MKSLLVALLFLAPLAAGCGAEPSSFEGSDQALQDARTSRVDWRLEESPGADSSFASSGTGSIDFAKDRGQLKVILEHRGKGEESKSMELRAVFIGHDTYSEIPYRGKTLWQKTPDSYEARGADRFAPGPDGPRPDEVLDLLIKSSEKVEQVGNDEIRGVSADHYRAHVAAKAIEDDAEMYGPKGLVVDAWIDGEGLLRRIRIPFGRFGPVEVIDLYDFGVPVDIEAPPKDELISEEELEKLTEKECAGKSEEDLPDWCMLYGGSIESSSSLEEYSPTETIPTTEEK